MVALALFAVITGIILVQISESRKIQQKQNKQIETYQLAQMALQTKQDKLNFNGVDVEVVRTNNRLKIYSQGELLLDVEKN